MESLWQCQLCDFRLFELVSHVRAIHLVDPGLRFVCNVNVNINGCQAVFKQTNMWYKHVTKKQYDSTLLIESHFQEDIVAEPCDDTEDSPVHDTAGQFSFMMILRNSFLRMSFSVIVNLQ